MPARSAMPVTSRVMTLLAAVVLASGVSVAVQVMPPSLLESLLSVPLGTVTSAVVKPVTASVKVNVTVAASPIFNAVSEMLMEDPSAGRAVSTA